MQLAFLPLDTLHRSRANMRFGRKPADVSGLLPSVRARGVLVPVIVRVEPDEHGADGYGVVAGDRRYTAACIVADEVRDSGNDPEPMPCAIIEEGDDAAALEASMLENFARLDPDEVKRWESFTRLVREGRSVEDIAATFGLPDLAVKRTLALGNLLPRIRSLYAAQEIDPATVRTLTLASKKQQGDWLHLLDDPEAYAPRGSNLKAWLLGGQSVKAEYALFDAGAAGLATVADLFGDAPCFADAAAFWAAQNAEVEARREEYLAQGWNAVVILPPSEHFASWEYEKRAKRKGGRVYLDVRASGEVVIHEGYIALRDARREARAGEPAPDTLGVDMARWWRADPAFFDLLRDKQVLGAMVAEVAGQPVADANSKEKGATLKKIFADHLAGTDGREQVGGWVPRWMRFPASAYTERGGVATVRANAMVAAAKADAMASDDDRVEVDPCDVSDEGSEGDPSRSARGDAEEAAVGRDRLAA